MNQRINYKSRFRILKGGKISLVISAMMGSVTLSFAAPSGGTVTSGTANIVQKDKITNINQTTQKASINWQKFGIKADEIVNFKQPDKNSITLNRVIGNERSVINGALNANGQVWILNSNGVLFGQNASVNTSGLLATTAKLSDIDFQNGNYNFTDTTANTIVNQGTINIENTGSVILASNEVKNEGTIKAVKGKIHLVGADSYSLNLNGNSLVNLTIDKGVLDAMVSNSGTILADAGEIYLTTKAVDELLKGVVNNTGVIEANSIDDLTGYVELFAHGGTANVAGTITAKDGFVETSGKKVKIDDSFRVEANKWLIDPVDFTVAASGGDMSGATLSTNLSTTDIEIQSANGSSGTDGNIYVNDSVTWSTDKKLTLNAFNDIFINSAITATNASGQLALHYGQGAVNAGNTSKYHIKAKVNLQAGDNFFTKLGSDGVETTWRVITDLGTQGSTTATDLQGMSGDVTKNYVLGADIDATSTSTWNTGTGWIPIGNHINEFRGNFDGLGHTIDGLTINRNGSTYQGFFGFTNASATIKNIGLTNVDITGKNYLGGLAGRNTGTIQNSYSTGTVSGTDDYIGGLVGYNWSGAIQNSYANSSVNGVSSVGGLAGFNRSGAIQNSYAIGTITGNDDVGGLVGTNHLGGTIQNSYATGTVSGNDIVGGLAGNSGVGTITASYYDNETNTATMRDSAYGKTKEEIRTLAQANWDNSIWSTIGRGASVAGYEILELPYLTGVTRDADKATTNTTLFNAGMGTNANPYTITNWTQLQNINNSNILTQNYYFSLVNDLLASTSGYTTQVKDGTTLVNAGTGWTPIGDYTNRFTGHFDGVNHTIDGLSINRIASDYQGLFGVANTGASIKNIGVTNIDIKGQNSVGGLLGSNFAGTIQNSYVTGSVSGNNAVGGLVGYEKGGITQNSYATASVSGSGVNIGGLLGYADGGTIQNSYANSSVNGGNSVGGFVGYNVVGTIENSYATGTVSGTNDVGGFVGKNVGGTITDSYYDNEANTATMNDSVTQGKTKAELATLAKANWNIEEDNTVEKDKLFLAWQESGNGYTKIWVVGTQEASTPTPEPTTPNEEEVPDQVQNQIDKIILTNKDIDILIRNNIDTNNFINQIKLSGGNLNIIPNVALTFLSGGINLPYGIARKFSANSNNTNTNTNEDEEQKN